MGLDPWQGGGGLLYKYVILVVTKGSNLDILDMDGDDCDDKMGDGTEYLQIVASFT